MSVKCNSITLAKPPKSSAGSHEEDGTERRCVYSALSDSKRGPDSFFFFGFGAIGNQKRASPDPFHENMVRKVYTAKYLVRTNFLWVRTHFFCSVNGPEEYCTGQVS